MAAQAAVPAEVPAAEGRDRREHREVLHPAEGVLEEPAAVLHRPRNPAHIAINQVGCIKAMSLIIQGKLKLCSGAIIVKKGGIPITIRDAHVARVLEKSTRSG